MWLWIWFFPFFLSLFISFSAFHLFCCLNQWRNEKVFGATFTMFCKIKRLSQCVAISSDKRNDLKCFHRKHRWTYTYTPASNEFFTFWFPNSVEFCVFFYRAWNWNEGMWKRSFLKLRNIYIEESMRVFLAHINNNQRNGNDNATFSIKIVIFNNNSRTKTILLLNISHEFMGSSKANRRKKVSVRDRIGGIWFGFFFNKMFHSLHQHMNAMCGLLFSRPFRNEWKSFPFDMVADMCLRWIKNFSGINNSALIAFQRIFFYPFHFQPKAAGNKAVWKGVLNSEFNHWTK